MKALKPVYGALLLSLTLHVLLFVIEPDMKSHSMPVDTVEKVEKVAIKFLSPVERVSPPPASSEMQPETRIQQAYQAAHSQAIAPFVQQDLPQNSASYSRQGVDNPVVGSSSVVTSEVVTSTTPSYNAPQAPIVSQNRLPEYLAVIRATVERNKEYPLVAKRMGIEGRVIVQVLINEDGYAQSINVVDSSGNRHLDTAAVNAVRSSQPFQAPGKFNLSGVNIEIPIAYRID